MSSIRAKNQTSIRMANMSGTYLFPQKDIRFQWLGGFFGILLFIVALNCFHLIALQIIRSGKGPSMVVSFSLAGFIAVASVVFIRWRFVSRNIFDAVGFHSAAFGSIGAAVLRYSLPAIAVGVAYAKVLELIGRQPSAFFGNELSFINRASTFSTLPWWQILMIVAIAPFWEEIIFRGIIYKDLRRRFGFKTAVLCSSMVFAFLHPVLAIVPVFVLGAMSAMAFERCKSLWAPICIHAIYNVVVLWVQH